MTWTEAETLEFKASFGEWNEAQVMCAFVNAKDGRDSIWCDDFGQPIGIEVGKTTIEDFLNKVRQNTGPVLFSSARLCNAYLEFASNTSLIEQMIPDKPDSCLKKRCKSGRREWIQNFGMRFLYSISRHMLV